MDEALQSVTPMMMQVAKLIAFEADGWMIHLLLDHIGQLTTVPVRLSFLSRKISSVGVSTEVEFSRQ